jgi:hypothetical protein
VTPAEAFVPAIRRLNLAGTLLLGCAVGLLAVEFVRMVRGL